MGREGTRPRRGVFGIALAGVAMAVGLQSALHLERALADHQRFDTIFDLDRSNGLPDLLSTLSLGAAGVAAAVLAVRRYGYVRAAAGCLAGILALLTCADLLHDGAHPGGTVGLVVVGLACAAAGLVLVLSFVARCTERVILAAATVALAGSFLVPALDRFDQRFERERGDPVREYQIVAKEGLELIGWSLVALALWGEATRRTRRTPRATAQASRAPAEPTRRVA